MAKNKEFDGDFNFSPSLCHHHVMKKLQPSLAYSGGEIDAWKKRVRNKLRNLLCLQKNKYAPLRVRSLGRSENDLGTIEKIVFTSEPNADVPAYMCIPHNAAKPYLTFICLQGHTTGMHNSIAVDFQNENRKIKVAGDRDFGLNAMRHGIAALCIEQRSFGFRSEKIIRSAFERSMCHEAVMHALALGRTLVGERVFDVDRGIDYLAQRGDIDMGTLGVMGNSGGGTASLYAVAMLNRIHAAIISCAFCTYADSIMSISHCHCNYIPGILKYLEAGDVLGCAAPKPVLIVAGKEDEIFPITGVRKAFRQTKRIYASAGAGTNCRLAEGAGGHRFYADLAWPIILKMLRKRKGQ